MFPKEKPPLLEPPFLDGLHQLADKNDFRRLADQPSNHEENFSRNLLALFAASYRTRNDDISPATPDDIEYLNSELKVDRLNSIHSWLWIVGRPMPPRPLHLQRIKSRELYITEQMDLHLVWSSKRIYIKPIPRFLLSTNFWTKYLCINSELYACAIGFLLSYTALIAHESDFRIAIDAHLLPEELTWPEWISLTEQLLSSKYASHINQRYIYGELRLGRLNFLYRITKGKVRGYLSNCSSYTEFMRENLTSFLTLFAYVSIVLSAMQVGLGTSQLTTNKAFNRVSYGFAVFAITAPLAAIAAVLALLLVLSLYYLIVTLAYRKRRLSRSLGND